MVSIRWVFSLNQIVSRYTHHSPFLQLSWPCSFYPRATAQFFRLIFYIIFEPDSARKNVGEIYNWHSTYKDALRQYPYCVEKILPKTVRQHLAADTYIVENHHDFISYSLPIIWWKVRKSEILNGYARFTDRYRQITESAHTHLTYQINVHSIHIKYVTAACSFCTTDRSLGQTTAAHIICWSLKAVSTNCLPILEYTR